MGRVLKTLIYDGEISLSLLDTTDIVQKAIELHKLSPLSAAALGRSLTASTFMATTLKNDGDKLSVTISGDGIGGNIVVCGNSKLEIRGLIDNPSANLPLKSNGKLDVAGCVGTSGRITVIKDIGLKEPYTGSCRIVSGELAEDFSAYYTYSEQQPTAMALGVKIGVDYNCAGAGGVVIQTMPGCSEESIAKAEKLISNFTAVSSMIENGGLDGIVNEFFKGEKFDEYTPVYKCICSRAYIESILLSMGEKELLAAVEDQGKIEVECHFCDKKYLFSKQEVLNMIKEAKS